MFSWDWVAGGQWNGLGVGGARAGRMVSVLLLSRGMSRGPLDCMGSQGVVL